MFFTDFEHGGILVENVLLDGFYDRPAHVEGLEALVFVEHRRHGDHSGQTLDKMINYLTLL